MENKYFIVFVCSYLNMGVKKHPTARDETQVCFCFHAQRLILRAENHHLLIWLTRRNAAHSEMLKAT